MSTHPVPADKILSPQQQDIQTELLRFVTEQVNFVTKKLPALNNIYRDKFISTIQKWNNLGINGYDFKQDRTLDSEDIQNWFGVNSIQAGDITRLLLNHNLIESNGRGIYTLTDEGVEKLSYNSKTPVSSNFYDRLKASEAVSIAANERVA